MIQASSGPLPLASANTVPSTDAETLATLRVLLGGSEVLKTGILITEAEVTDSAQASASATVHDLSLSLLPLQPLLSLAAEEVRSEAEITGSCGWELVASGATTLVDVQAATLGLGLNVSASPAPNTVLLDLLGIRVVLNEQILGGDGIYTRSLTVNALHVSINNALLSLLGVLKGDIVIAHSEANVHCQDEPNEA